MGTLLHVSASPRGGASESLAIAEAFLDAYRETHPEDRVEAWDLWDGSLPGFGRDFQQTFFDDWLEWAGITDHTAVTFRPNLVTQDADTVRRLAHDQARDLGKRF